MTAPKKRVLIIGLDGFTWTLGHRFMAEGVMPHLKELVEKGCHGNLESVMPFETAPAWSSFQTGCLPGKTKVFAFHTFDRKHKKIRLNSFNDIAVPSLWELADKAGKTVVSLNMPISSPPPEVNGIVIPGLLCPKLSRQTVHPPEAFDKYIKPHKDYLIVNLDPKEAVDKFTRQAIATERPRLQVAMELMKNVNWDIFCFQMQSSDPMQHKLWWALDSEAKGYSPEQYKQALAFYRFCDEAIDKITQAAGHDVLTLIVSDHGLCALEKSASINVWLKQHGYLKLLPRKPDSSSTVVKNLLKEKIPPLKLLARFYGYARKNLKRRGSTPLYCVRHLEHLRRIIDFQKTKVFCLGAVASMVYINDTPERRKEQAEKLTTQLLADLGPQSENHVIDKIATGIETYSQGVDSDSLPDLVLQYRQGIITKLSPLGETVVKIEEKDGKQMGTHCLNGILVAHGPNVEKGKELNARIVDIVPTILAYLGTPIPKHVDGKALNELFAQPLQMSYEDITFHRTKSKTYSDSEQAEVEKHLTDLGYL